VADPIKLDELQVDRNNLYREDVFTDLRVASIRRLIPIKADGSDDPSRPTLFTAETQILTPQGLVPVHAPVEAGSLQEAIDKFPEAIQAGVDRMIEEAREMRRQAANRIITPQEAAGGKIILG